MTDDISSFKRFDKVKTRDRSGIYLIYNLINGKIYIGSAINLANRKACHLKDLRRNKHKNPYLQNSYNKYGEHSFGFYLIEYVNDVNLLVDREQVYLDSFAPYNKKVGYNIAKIAGSTLGVKASIETRRKQSIAAKNRKYKTPKAEDNPRSRLTWEIVREMKSKYATGKCSQSDLSSEFGFSRRYIGDILNGLAWDDGSGKVVKPRKMDKEKAYQIRQEFNSGDVSRAELANKYNVSYNTIRFILVNKTWV